MKILLQHKIFVGYFLLMAIIGSMVAIVLHERHRVQKIENESIAIFQTQHNINTAHRYITTLVTYGESVMVWNKADSLVYQEHRMQTDSMLQTLRTQCKDFVRPVQIDSLRMLLAVKEEHLFQIMGAIRQQRRADSLLSKQKSIITTQTTTRTVTRKKKGIAGFFGGKETIQQPVVTTRQTTPDKELISLLNKQQRDIETYTDSLRLCNREINRKLRSLITSLDEQTWNTFRSKEERLKASYEHSSLVITGLIIFSIILLFISYLVIQRDIKVKARNRKRLEETIEQNVVLLEMRKNIILTISHDIRAPLNIISGSAELAMDTRDKKRRNTHLDNIRIVCRHVVHLLNNLLDVYRLNEAKEIRNDVPFDLNALLERIAFGFSHVVNNKGILFSHDFTDVKLCGDMDRIEQILDNLLSNAVKFTETGTISLNARYSDGELLLEVKDTGIGMSEEFLKHIYEPFVQERVDARSVYRGTGMGMTIVKGLVEQMGGTIEITSELGVGSTFIVTIPFDIAEKPKEQVIIPKGSNIIKGKHLLMAEDNELNAEMAQTLLTDAGAAVAVVENGRKALELFEKSSEGTFDLILMDVMMPIMDGFEATKAIRELERPDAKTIPIIAMTANAFAEDAERCLASGMNAHMAKPLEIEKIKKIICEQIKLCDEKCAVEN